MNQLLIDEYPLLVLPSLAEKIGLSEAIVLQQVHFWISKRKHLIDGKYWVYNTYDGWANQFPFWSVITIKRIFLRLEERGLIISDNHNRMKIDRTKWYTIDYGAIRKIA